MDTKLFESQAKATLISTGSKIDETLKIVYFKRNSLGLRKLGALDVMMKAKYFIAFV